MRLDRFISENSTYSRTQIKQLVREQRVFVNSACPQKSSAHINIDNDTVSIDGQTITAIGRVYIMLNKPLGHVSALHDTDHPTVVDLLENDDQFMGERPELERIQRAHLQIVGRLDKDTTGLLLLTNDGEWNHRITSPKYTCTKVYIADLAAPVNERDVATFAAGIQLHNEKKPTLPANLELIHSHRARVHIQEGKYHQIKRMFSSVGNSVLRLHRECIGELSLDARLHPGQFRPLTTTEVLLF